MLLYAIVNAAIIGIIPIDRNSFLYEYNHKIELLGGANSDKRIILIGGSSVVYGTDSKTIVDSVGLPVVNFGLHGGIGIRYVFEDFVRYARKGDIVILQIEYENFYNGGFGNDRTLAQLMPATNWRNIGDLKFEQYANILTGLPSVTIGNLNRLLKYPFRKSWNSPSKSEVAGVGENGFNQYGDEMSHWYKPSKRLVKPKGVENQIIDHDFMKWLTEMISISEAIGAQVLMIPPVIIKSRHQAVYNDCIAKALIDIDHPYVVEPEYMVLDDSCTFDGGYHVNREGVRQNTQHLIEILSNMGKKNENNE